VDQPEGRTWPRNRGGRPGNECEVTVVPTARTGKGKARDVARKSQPQADDAANLPLAATRLPRPGVES
jgi:hypothetical protein